MAKAPGILTSAVRLDEGVPPLQVVQSHTPITTGRSLARSLPVTPLFRRFVIRFREGSFLHSYSDEGIFYCASLDQAKVFVDAPEIAADLLCGEIIPVLCRSNGTDKRRCLRFPELVVVAATTRDKAGPLNEETLPQASVETTRTAKGKEVDANGVKSDCAGNGEESGGRKLNLENFLGGSNEVGNEGGVNQETICPPPSTAEGKKLFLEFISTYLGVKVFGIQPGYKHIPDSYLFVGPYRSTMTVPVSLMLGPREDALAFVHSKIAEKEKAFEANR
jgi:hypothetical protein